MTYQDFTKNLWENLNIARRSITFHIVDSEGWVTFSSGIVDTVDDLYDSDFADILMDNTDAPAVEVSCVESWILGNGEADHADDAALEFLRKAMVDHPDYFDRFLKEHADSLAIISDFTLDNPWYEEDDDDWDDNDADLDD